MHDRQGNVGDFSQTVTTLGTLTTAAELNQSGATVYDSPQEVERKLASLRNADASLSPFPVNSSYISTTARPTNWRLAARLVGLAVTLWLVWWLNMYFNAKGPIEVKESTTLLSLPGESDRRNPVTDEDRKARPSAFVDHFGKESGHLFTVEAPIKQFYKSCDFKGCDNADMGVFKAFKKYAKSPATYWDDLCTVRSMAMEEGSVAYASPKWKITKGVRQSDSDEIRCTLANQSEVANQYLVAKSQYQKKVYAGLGILSFALIFLLWRATRHMQN